MNRDTTEMGRMEKKEPEPTGSRIPPGRPRRKLRWLFVLIPVVLIAAGYEIYRTHFAFRESTDDAQIDGHINPVAAKVSGYVTSINVRDNQFVKAGTVIVQIDPRDYRIALDRAKADLAAAQSGAEAARTQMPITSTTTSSQLRLADAVLEQAEGSQAASVKDVETARARLEASQARLRETQAVYTRATQDLERMKLLIAKDEISKQQYDAAVAAAEAARAASDSARAGIQEIAKAIEATQARVAQADARVKEAQANQQASQTGPQHVAISRSNARSSQARVQLAQAALAQAELNLEYSQVKAPVDGIVSQRKVELGQYVQTGQPLLAIIPLHNVWVMANFKENQLKNMQAGQKARVTVDAYGGRRFEGHIDSIAAATGARFSLLPPENATGNYVKVVQRIPIKIVIDSGQDDAYPLRPGLSVVVTVDTRTGREGKAEASGSPSF